MFTDQYLTTEFGRLRYWHAGQGEPVLFTPGLGSSIELGLPFLSDLAQRFSVYAVDPIGSGKSDKPKKLHYTVQNMAKSIEAFITAKELKKVNLIGHSLGGAISIQTTLDIPSAINKLILIGCAGFDQKLPLSFRLLTLPLIGELLLRPTRKLTSANMRSFVYNPASISEEVIDRSYQIASQPGQIRAVLNIIRANANLRGIRDSVYEPVFPLFKSIHQPVLLIWGKQDPITHFGASEIALKTLQNVTLLALDECGHIPQMEKTEVVTKAMLDFL